MDDSLKQVQKLIENFDNIYAITGAGISTNAGIIDFRGPKGIYTTKIYDPDKTFDIDYFLINPKNFYDFIKDFIVLIDKTKPTFTHKFLFKLEKIDKLKGIITQNIDLLHEKAQSKNIIKLHGSIEDWFCIECQKNYSLLEVRKKIYKNGIPKCDLCDGVIRPDIVFYKESVKGYDLALKWVLNADLLLVIGTSLKVYPASYLPILTKGKIVIVNKGDISLSHLNKYIHINDDIDQFFKKLSKSLSMEVDYD